MCGRTVGYIAFLVICAAAQNFWAPQRLTAWFFRFVRPHKIFVRPQRLTAWFFRFVRSHAVLRQIVCKPHKPLLMDSAAAQSVCAVAQNQFSNRFPNFCNPILPQICWILWFWYRIFMQTTISLNKPCKGSIFTKDLVNQDPFQPVFPFLRFSPNFYPDFPILSLNLKLIHKFLKYLA